jgi:hypothetical protein
MFVITADQIDSRNRPDIADETMRELETVLRGGLVLPIDRTAGDEIQMLLKDAHHALMAILRLTRDAQWSVGCGIGGVVTPLPANAREAGGTAFVAARDAVNDAKKRDTGFALRRGHESPIVAGDAEALIDLLLHIRARRSPEGWEIYELMTAGSTQADAAKHLGITPQAASKRARAAAIRAEIAAVLPLERLLASTDDVASETDD